MNTTRLCALLLLEMTHLLAQNYSIGGSIFIAAICKDGILIVSDSRGSVLDKRLRAATPIAYFDGIQKIFFLGDRAVVNTGQGFIGDIPIGSLWDKSRERFPESPLDAFLPNAFELARSLVSLDAVTLLKKNMIALAGVQQRSAAICYYDGDGAFGCIHDGLVQSSPTKFVNYQSQLVAMTMVDAQVIATQSIVDYIAADPKRKLTMGGDFHVAHVTASGPSWVPLAPTVQRWANAEEMIRAIRGGQVSITLVPPSTRRELDELLSGGVSK